MLHRLVMADHERAGKPLPRPRSLTARRFERPIKGRFKGYDAGKRIHGRKRSASLSDRWRSMRHPDQRRRPAARSRGSRAYNVAIRRRLSVLPGSGGVAGSPERARSPRGVRRHRRCGSSNREEERAISPSRSSAARTRRDGSPERWPSGAPFVMTQCKASRLVGVTATSGLAAWQDYARHRSVCETFVGPATRSCASVTAAPRPRICEPMVMPGVKRLKA